jgi:hypothetical protein
VITDEQLQALRRRAHQHTSRCYGRYEPCGEHHAHDDKCGDRPLVCGQREEPELAMMLDEIDSLRVALKDGDRLHAVRKAAKVLSRKLAYHAAWAGHRGNHAEPRYDVELATLDTALAALDAQQDPEASR